MNYFTRRFPKARISQPDAPESAPEDTTPPTPTEYALAALSLFTINRPDIAEQILGDLDEETRILTMGQMLSIMAEVHQKHAEHLSDEASS